MKTAPDVTVVVVAYRAAGRIARCLDSLASQDVKPGQMQVIVVDNDSRDGTAELVERDHPWVTVIRSPQNLGFAGGNDLALQSSDTWCTVLLNDDAVAAPTFVSTLLRSLQAAPPDVAALTARVLLAEHFRNADCDDPDAVRGPDGCWLPDADGPTRLVNSTGNQVRTDGFGVDRGWLADDSRHAPPPEVFGFCGAAVALRTDVIRQVGGFDRRLFMYYEDTDLSWRLRLAGFRIEYCAAAVAEHEHAASSGEGSDFFRFHDSRNRLLTATKNATAPMALRVTARYCLTTASMALRRSQPRGVVRTRLRAFISYLRLLPHALRERRRIGRVARVSRSTVQVGLVRPGRFSTGTYRG